MSAHHFFADDVTADVIALTGDEAFHAARALRVTTGEQVTVGDGAGTVVTGTVGDVSASRVMVEVQERRTVARPRPWLVACPAVPKAGKLDLVVQKLTELGVPEIRAWFAERSVVRWDERKRAAQATRLTAIARAAAKQARLAWFPSVTIKQDFSDESAAGVVCHEGASVALRHALPREAPEAFALVTGPEGGLSENEIARAEGLNLQVVSLGSSILRAETATIIGAALVLSGFNLLG